MAGFSQLNSGHTLNPDPPRAHRKNTTVVTACFIPHFPFLPGPKQEIALTQIPGATVMKPELYVGARTPVCIYVHAHKWIYVLKRCLRFSACLV